MEAHDVQWDVIGDVIGLVQEIRVPVVQRVTTGRQADELDLVIWIGMSSYAQHHLVVDVGVGFGGVLMLPVYFVEALPVLEVVFEWGVVLYAVFVDKTSLRVPANLSNRDTDVHYHRSVEMQFSTVQGHARTRLLDVCTLHVDR